MLCLAAGTLSVFRRFYLVELFASSDEVTMNVSNNPFLEHVQNGLWESTENDRIRVFFNETETGR